MALLLTGFVLFDEGCLVEAAFGVEVGALEVDAFADSFVVVVTAVEVEFATATVLGFFGPLLDGLLTETKLHFSITATGFSIGIAYPGPI